MIFDSNNTLTLYILTYFVFNPVVVALILGHDAETGVFRDNKTNTMGLLPDTQNCGLRMHRECRERFPYPPTSKETAS